MQQLPENTSLSWGDALFLYLEREGMPLNIASVAVFEGVISLDECVDFVASKLPLIPRYLQRVVIPPLNLGLPTWEYDPEFDIHNHIHELTLKRGTEAELKAASAKILSGTMDRRHPLWDMTLMRGLHGNRTGMLVRVHHCLADGIAGVGLMNVVMDPKAISHPPASKLPRLRVPPPRDAATLVVDALVNSSGSLVQRILAMHAELIELAQKAIAGAPQLSLSEINRLLPEFSAPAQRLPFNTICRGPQKIAWCGIPMADIKAVRQATGATVNDIVVTVVTSALRRYAERQGVKVKGRPLRIAVPMNMRGNGSAGDLGNRISFLPVSVPLDIRKAGKLLAAVSQRMQFLKNAHAAELVGLAGTLLGTIPPALQALAGPLASQLPISLCNTICTNVPGPQVPLYLIGHEMLCWYPYVPIGGEMGINCAMLSYNGTAYFCFTGDVQAAPGLLRLEKFLSTSFAELQKAVGIRPRPQKRRLPKRDISILQPSDNEKEVALPASA